jgi:nitrite reductase/ring-hydroxylating ferredoxin subunit
MDMKMKQLICDIADIPAAGSLVVPFFGRELHVYRSGERIRAAANTCLHFGGPLECKDGKLVCAWHQATYDIDTGNRLEGPAPAGSKLMFLSTRVEADQLYYVWKE